MSMNTEQKKKEALKLSLMATCSTARILWNGHTAVRILIVLMTAVVLCGPLFGGEDAVLEDATPITNFLFYFESVNEADFVKIWND